MNFTKKVNTISELIAIGVNRKSYTKYSTQQSRFGLICGGKGNLGDDAMTEAAQELFLNKHLLRFTHPKQEHRLSYLGLSGSNYFNSVFLGGGTLICPTWSKQVRAALEQDHALYTLGTGVGSNGFHQKDIVNLQDWKPLLARFKKLGVRGPRSKRTLESMGINHAEVIGDLALSLTKDSLTQPSNQPKFAINITTPNGEDYRSSEYSRLQDLEPVLKKLIDDGWEPVPITMHPWDIKPLERLMRRIGVSDINIQLTKDKNAFFESVSPCRFTIGVRLHSAILSCCVGVPPLMLGYRDKCLDFMESMNLEEWHIDLRKAANLEISDKVIMLSRDSSKLRQDIHNRAKNWKNTIQIYVESISS